MLPPGSAERPLRNVRRGPRRMAATDEASAPGSTSTQHGNGQTGIALPATRILVPVQRDLRRPQRLLGLRTAGRRAEAERARGLVARHGHRTQRAGGPGRCSVRLRNDRARLHDHHAPAGVEVLRALRPVPRPHGRLPRVETSLSLRSGPRQVGRRRKGRSSLWRRSPRWTRSRPTSSTAH